MVVQSDSCQAFVAGADPATVASGAKPSHLRNNSTATDDTLRTTVKNGLVTVNGTPTSDAVSTGSPVRSNDDNNNRHNSANNSIGAGKVAVNGIQEDVRPVDLTPIADSKEGGGEKEQSKILVAVGESEEDGDGVVGEGMEEEEEAEAVENSGPSAPEGGWGFMVVFAGFIIYWLVPGMIRSYGAVYMELLETFPDCTAAEAGWIPALLSSISIGLAPISAVLGKIYTCRNVVFVGGLLCSLGLSLSYFATSIFYLYMTFGLITGIGAGLCTTPSVIVLNQYFVKKRALASGICLSGAAVGSFTIPIFVKYIVAEFRFRGTLLIMGAIILHVCAMSLLFTPDGRWEIKPKKKKVAAIDISSSDSSSPDGVTKPLLQVPLISNGKTTILPSLDKPQKDLQFLKPPVFTVDDTHAPYQRPPPRTRSFVVAESTTRRRMDSDRMSLNSRLGVIGRDTPPTPSRGHRLPPHQAIQMGSATNGSSNSVTSQQQRVRMLSSSMSHSINDVGTASVFYDGTDDDSSDDDERKATDSSTVDGKKARKRPTCARVWRRVAGFFKMCCDFTLFHELTYVATTVAGCCIAGAFPHVLFFVPVFAQQMGFSKVDAGMLLSICSAVDIVSRISYGWFMDLNLIRRCHGLALSCAVCGIGTMLIPLSNSYGMLAFFTSMYGFGSGTAFMLLPVILADNHGVAKLPSTYGLMRLFQGAVMLVIPPFAGFLKDTTGVYEYCFLLMGGMLCCGSITMLLVPLAQKRDARKGFAIPEPL